MTAAFFEFEDVLARGDRSPIKLGVNLLRLMRPGYRLILSSAEKKPELIHWWLMEQGFPKDTFSYQYHLAADEEEMDEYELLEHHLNLALVNIPIELVITASPSKVAMCMKRSITGLLFGSPATARPENRPGGNVRPWEEIESEVTRRRILRTAATAGEPDDD